MIVAVAVLLIYTLLVGVGLIGGWLRVSWGYLLMILPCLVPLFWYGYGYGREANRERNLGLLFSIIGWALAALVLLIRYVRAGYIEGALANGASPASLPPNNPALEIICLAGAIVCLLIGAIFALRGRETAPLDLESNHY